MPKHYAAPGMCVHDHRSPAVMLLFLVMIQDTRYKMILLSCHVHGTLHFLTSVNINSKSNELCACYSTINDCDKSLLHVVLQCQVHRDKW